MPTDAIYAYATTPFSRRLVADEKVALALREVHIPPQVANKHLRQSSLREILCAKSAEDY